MRSKIGTKGQEPRSFIEQARRTQIIASAIEVIAERGFGRASLVEIARHAGISKGVISYHFGGKDELIRETVTSVYTEAFETTGNRMERESSAAGQLRAYIRGRLDYMKTHRRRMLAMVEIFSNFRNSEGRLHYDASYNEPVFEWLESIFKAGQESGEFRAFGTRVMAIALQGALDSLLFELPLHPEIDLETYAAELTMLFDHATRAQDTERTTGSTVP